MSSIVHADGAMALYQITGKKFKWIATLFVSRKEFDQAPGKVKEFTDSKGGKFWRKQLSSTIALTTIEPPVEK